MARRKTLRKQQFQEFPNCFHASECSPGHWSTFFGKKGSLTLELGCGHADFSFELAKRFPGRNFVGVDLKMDRMWRAAQRALSEGIHNIGFVSLNLLELANHFLENEAEELWITFPDPFPKKRQAKHRMVNTAFLKGYQKVLKPGGKLHYKTDNLPLFHYSLEEFVKGGLLTFNQLSFDLHGDESISADAKVLTAYERRFLEMDMKINYLQAYFN
ncbi:MAG: tRNA (guanosine(46)-N7)-methyltransferase TrmB [Bacteroidota bacterium]